MQNDGDGHGKIGGELREEVAQRLWPAGRNADDYGVHRVTSLFNRRDRDWRFSLLDQGDAAWRDLSCGLDFLDQIVADLKDAFARQCGWLLDEIHGP